MFSVSHPSPRLLRPLTQMLDLVLPCDFSFAKKTPMVDWVSFQPIPTLQSIRGCGPLILHIFHSFWGSPSHPFGVSAPFARDRPPNDRSRSPVLPARCKVRSGEVVLLAADRATLEDLLCQGDRSNVGASANWGQTRGACVANLGRVVD